MQKSDLHVAPDDAFAVELDHDSDGAVHGWVSGPHVEEQRLVQQRYLVVVGISFERLHGPEVEARIVPRTKVRA